MPLLAGAQLRTLRSVYDGIGFLNQYNIKLNRAQYPTHRHI